MKALRICVAWALALPLGTAGCDRAVDYLDLERMQDQDKVEVYEVSPSGSAKRGMRVPPGGTVPRERELGPTEITLGLGPDGEVKEIPVAVDRALIMRGRDRFERFCAACHGILGTGNPAVVENATLRPPPSLHLPRIRSQPPGRLFTTVTEGFGLMPPYAADLSIRDRWAVIAYLPVLWTSQGTALASLPPDLETEARAALEQQEPPT